MVEKTKENVYVWYSTATDVTGKNIIEALGCKGGTEKPNEDDVSMVICWGAKTTDDVYISNNTEVLNHPDNIRSNRNKFEALNKMAGKVNIPRFCAAEDVKYELGSDDPNTVKLPLVGRTKYHQGGKGFWMCPTQSHVENALENGAQYFQEMIEIKDEYRLHMFDGKILRAVKKVKRNAEETKEAFINDEFERQKKLADKYENNFDSDIVTMVLKRIAARFVHNWPDMFIRSNHMGWKFVPVQEEGYNNELNDVAVKAVEALGLNFGAVDCCTDIEGNAYVIEVNTGPGLSGTTFNKWITAIEEKIHDALYSNKEDQNNNMYYQNTGWYAPENFNIEVKEEKADDQDEFKNALRTLSNMLDVAKSNEEVEMLKTIASRIFS